MTGIQIQRENIASCIKGTDQSVVKTVEKKNNNIENKKLGVISIREGLTLSTASNIKQCQSQINHTV